MDIAYIIVFRLLEAMFVIGLAGCLFVIPSTAYMMFKVLVGQDDDPPEELEVPAALPHA
jgi:hypothetical protein